MFMRPTIFLVSFCGCVWQWLFVIAQQPQNSPAPAQPPASITAAELRDGELAISGRFARFERMLSQMADILGRQDPERADLLRRAIGKGREDQVREDIESVIALLSKGELGTATEKQGEVVASLEALLKLLQSEDRRSAVEREQERLNNLLKELRGITAQQKSARSETQNSEAPSSTAPSQQKALKQTDEVLRNVQEHDDDQRKEPNGAEKSENSDSGENKKSGDPKSSDGKSGKKSERENSEKKSGEKSEPDNSDKDSTENKNPDTRNASGKPADQAEKTEPSDPGEKSSGPSKSGKKPSGKSGKKNSEKSSEKESPKTPGRDELQKAREEMEQALEKLKEQQKTEALDHQDKALEELRQAQEKLEEMLKQLREEEKEMMLASLEARFQRMLIAETEIHEGTVSLAATPQKDWLDQYYGRCRELAQQQSELTIECAQTVNLLREDGTSVSILIAVEDIEADMSSVTTWLQESKVTELTQSVQKDILESLKQLIETTQREMQEMQEENAPSQPPQGEPKESLVALIAEIRMLKNLQLQVNRRTRQVDTLLQSAPEEEGPRLRKQLRELAIRQNRLVESAKELAKQPQ